VLNFPLFLLYFKSKLEKIIKMKQNYLKVVSLIVLTTLQFVSFGQQMPAKKIGDQSITYKSTTDANGYIRCATMEADSIRRSKNPNLPTLAQDEVWLQGQIEKFKAKQKEDEAAGIPKATLLTIPMVIHIIHNGDAIGTNENITTAQALSQVQVLNEDFRRMLGTPGYNTHPDGADIEIEFCMAVVDPNGNPTDGIDRVNEGIASFSGLNDVDAIKPNSIWDPTQYMNMWTVNYGNSGLLGFAQFPNSSGLSGINANNGAANTDGVVADYRSFGSKNIYPAGNYSAPYDLGRTMTHEVGHWLGLRHIWGDANCGNDFCNDTPQTQTSNGGCPTQTTCDGIQDMVQNYMDYTNDACMNIFTDDQKTRIRTVMTVSPRRASLAASTVCQNPISDDAGISDVVTPAGTLCGGNFTPEITLKNYGNNNITVVTVNYDIDGGASTVYNWNGTLTPGSTVNITLPSMSAAAGAHVFNASTSLPNGVTDGTMSNDAFASNFTIDLASGAALPINEGFTVATFPPTNWTVTNGGNATYTWEHDASNGTAPTVGNSTVIDNFTANTAGDIDDLNMPAVDLSGMGSATLTFDVAYARYNATYADQLDVVLSNDCGQTWNVIYSKASAVLATDPDQTGAYTSPTTWRNESIDLTPYVGSSKVEIAFRSISGYGQYLYLDNINLTGASNCTATFSQSTVTEMCNGDNDGSITVNFTSGNSTGATFNIGSGAQASGTFPNLSQGTYNVTVIDGDACTTVVPVTLGGPTALNTGVTVTNISCNGQVDGQLVATATGGTPSITYNIGAGAVSSGTFPGLAAGPYSITILDGNNCSAVVNGTVVEPAVLSASTGSISPELFGTDGSVTLNVAGGTPVLTYSWTGPNGYTSTAQSPTNLVGGLYSVTVTDARGCTVSVVDILVPSQLGIEDLSNIEFEAYPNPSNGTLNVILGNVNGVNAVSVTDLSGRIVYENNSAIEKSFTIHLDNVSNGTYMLNVETEDNILTKRIVIKK
jgi:hypothetical protein